MYIDKVKKAYNTPIEKYPDWFEEGYKQLLSFLKENAHYKEREVYIDNFSLFYSCTFYSSSSWVEEQTKKRLQEDGFIIETNYGYPEYIISGWAEE